MVVYYFFLAISKLGATYCPIDVKYPGERVLQIIKTVESDYLITNLNKPSDNYPESVDVNIIHAESLISKNDSKKNLPLEKKNYREIAYIMFTSGSTGSPKGILIKNKSIIRVVKNTNYLEINSEDKFLQFSNYAFDGSTFEIYGALLNGAELIIPDP